MSRFHALQIAKFRRLLPICRMQGLEGKGIFCDTPNLLLQSKRYVWVVASAAKSNNLKIDSIGA